ncbi:MAG: rhodanese-like domain-containing protein [Burkholderiaceae bacterium]
MKRFGITPEELQQALASDHPPMLVDVRRAAIFEHATALIAGATWQDPANVGNWGANLSHSIAVVVYCVHGHEISQNCAADLYARGMNVRFLEGGFEAWRLAGGVVVAKDVPQN